MKLFLILFGTLCLGSNYLIAQNLIGGKLTEHFPELIAIRSGQGFCSSTLIGPNTILTAAHCIDKKTKKMRLHSQNINGECEISEYYRKHPSLDLALCKLDQKIILDKYPRLAEANEIPEIEDKIVLTGYGCTKRNSYDWKLRAGYAYITRHVNNTYWARKKSSKQAALCFGDSGGGSFKYIKNPKKDEHVVMGVNSQGDIEKLSILVSIGSDLAQEFINDFAKKTGSEICGVSIECEH